ncbi:unnamed protein product [Miscanthus lutarioriparius]|uniref:DDE Tnp4 domain-containing protein n=1 Tax=Miscanthus lutarioriparius TaxID=422564 RepID=A0A811QA02_9POAL|nr:unnamed protein product [Miscanthus lutarioriparius]
MADGISALTDVTCVPEVSPLDNCNSTSSLESVGRKRGADWVAASGPSGSRRLWVKERDHPWWDKMNSPDCPEEVFRHAFRMSRATFDAICKELDAVSNLLSGALPIRQRVAICIWHLATGESLRLVSKRFGVGISTCHKLVLEVCNSIKSVLMPKVVQWPEAPEASGNGSAKFEAVSGIPNVVGVMYTTHIPIIAPKANVAAYFNRRHTKRNQKTSYSISVQGVVDAAGAFTDVCIGWPGSMSDADVLERSALCAQRGAAGRLQGQWVVGGAGYPLMDWLLVPYTKRNMIWAQHVFNERLDGLCAVARDAFQRLKTRWGCLQKRYEVKLQDLPMVIGACCVLHNICERANEAVDPELAFQIFDDDMVAENPVRSMAASSARDAIAHNLLHRSSHKQNPETSSASNQDTEAPNRYAIPEEVE